MDASCPHCSSDHHTQKRPEFATTASSRLSSHPCLAHLPKNTPLRHPLSLSCVTITPLSRSLGYLGQLARCRSNMRSRSSLPSAAPPSLCTRISSSFKISLSLINAKALISPGHRGALNHCFARQACCHRIFREPLNSSSVSNPILFADCNCRLR